MRNAVRRSLSDLKMSAQSCDKWTVSFDRDIAVDMGDSPCRRAGRGLCLLGRDRGREGEPSGGEGLET